MGSKKVVEVAQEKARRMLTEHQPLPLDNEVVRKIEEILKRATKNLVRAAT